MHRAVPSGPKIGSGDLISPGRVWLPTFLLEAQAQPEEYVSQNSFPELFPPGSRCSCTFVGVGVGQISLHHPCLLPAGAVAALEAADLILYESNEQLVALKSAQIDFNPGVNFIKLNDQHPFEKYIITPEERCSKAVRLFSGVRVAPSSVISNIKACIDHGIPVQLYPNTTGGNWIPGYLGIQGQQSSGLVEWGDPGAGEDLTPVPTGLDVVVSGTSDRLQILVDHLIDSGWSPNSKTVTALDACTINQFSVSCLLKQLVKRLSTEPLEDGLPLHIVLGPAVEQYKRINWFENKSLFVWRVLVPTTVRHLPDVAERLQLFGATSMEIPTLAVEPPRSPQVFDRALEGLIEGRFRWIVLTSVTATKALTDRLATYGVDSRALSGLGIAAVGEENIAHLCNWGILPDLIPMAAQTSAALGNEFPAFDEAHDPINRVLIPQAEVATSKLSEKLTSLGWEVEDVTAYRSVRAAPPDAEVREDIKSGRFDAFIFTSATTVRNMIGIAGKPHPRSVIAALGPGTAAACVEHGLEPHVIGNGRNPVDLVNSLHSYAVARRQEMMAEGKYVTKPSEKRQSKRKLELS